MSVWLPACLCVYPSVCLAVCLAVCLSACLPAYLPVYLFICLSVLFFCLSVCRYFFDYLSVSQSVSQSIILVSVCFIFGETIILDYLRFESDFTYITYFVRRILHIITSLFCSTQNFVQTADPGKLTTQQSNGKCLVSKSILSTNL